MDYKKMYYTLFQGMTDAIERLKKAQQDAEWLYMDSNAADITVLPKNSRCDLVPGEDYESNIEK